MQIRDLAGVIAVAEHGGVTDAAAALGITQPTMSRSLGRVETELGVRLFERVPSGVVLNPDGELALAAARELVERYERLRADLAERLDPDSGVVRLAFLDSMATSLVPRLLRDFHQAAPRARIELRQEPGHEIVRDLGSGAAELAVTSLRPAGAFGWIGLQEERLVLVVAPSHRLAGRRRVSLVDLAGEDLVTTPVGFGYRRLVDSLFGAAGVVPQVAFESADLATIEGLVAAGLGVALLPETLAGVSGTAGITLAARGARRSIGLTWRTDVALAPAAARFCAFVERWAADGGS
ncbi:DNA-binding transcriptional LysR family regulator [Mumia flava]|uniref:DNA-binding transcriptional LysR family regulator n=1 Tax=Mumia flava TaxID=1348852 RepID=A0A0B2B596_9ACTN|nr:LysR family transcriptional regulator [Mumia flava]PJJ54346.1 DNA-binding transcriptional LysR family regulator [Mumia flava]